MKVVGLVGESGTGKTTIAEHLEKKGGGRIDADAIVHQILKDDDEVKSAVRKRFGNGVFRGDEIDRLIRVSHDDQPLAHARTIPFALQWESSRPRAAVS